MPSLSEELKSYTAVVVTGGSSGIGKSFIELMGKLNPALRFCNLSRREPDVKISRENLNHFSCDLSRSADIDRVAGSVVAWLRNNVPVGRILLINNSGFGSYGLFPEPNLGHHAEMIDVNVRAPVQLTGLLLPLLRERGGAVMNVASTASFQPTPYMATYGATKAFLLNWSLALNEEWRGTGVRVLAVCPGPTSTEFHRRAGLQPNSVGDKLSMTCEAVVLQALQALAAGKSQVVTGWTNKLSTLAGSIPSRPLAARVAAMVLKRYWLRRTSP